jgi:hypothetical protein
MSESVVANDATKRRLRQFGIRDLMLVSACLAVTLGLYREAYLGVAMAVLLTMAFTALLRQTKQLEPGSHLPVSFWFATGAVLSLLLDGLLGWCSGYFGGVLVQWYIAFVCARVVMFSFALAALFVGVVKAFTAAFVDWRSPPVRIGLSGRAAIVVLCVPVWYSLPLRDLGVRMRVRSIGMPAIVADLQEFEKQRMPIGIHPERYPALKRLGVKTVNLRRGNEFHAETGMEHVHYLFHGSLGDGSLDVQTSTMAWRRVGRWEAAEKSASTVTAERSQ